MEVLPQASLVITNGAIGTTDRENKRHVSVMKTLSALPTNPVITKRKF